MKPISFESLSFSLSQGLTEGDAGTHIAAGVKSFLGHFIGKSIY